VSISFGDQTIVLENGGTRAFSDLLLLAPLIFIVGLFFIILAFLGPHKTDLDRFLRSLSGQLVESFLALVATGLYVLYITIIGSRRFHNADQNVGTWRWYWEFLPSCFLLLVVVFGTLIWQLLRPEAAIAAHPTIALAWFVAALATTMPTL